MARMINCLVEALNVKQVRLSKYLVVIIDQDLFEDVDFCKDNFYTIKEIIPYLLRWLARQVNNVLRQKRMDILDKRPGAVPDSGSTKIIFVKMLKRIGHFHDQSKIRSICGLRARFNDSLNDVTAKLNQRILTVNSCNSYDHFDRCGNLSIKGKEDFWWKLDDLIQ